MIWVWILGCIEEFVLVCPDGCTRREIGGVYRPITYLGSVSTKVSK